VAELFDEGREHRVGAGFIVEAEDGCHERLPGCEGQAGCGA